MKNKNTPTIPPDYRAVFLHSGLHFGRCFGSKSGYSRENPGSFFIANACIYTRQKKCVWRGDLDLAEPDDRQGLVEVSRRLNRILYVVRERAEDDLSSFPRSWLAENAIVAVWRGTIYTIGFSHRLFGTLEQIIARYHASRPAKRARRGKFEKNAPVSLPCGQKAPRTLEATASRLVRAKNQTEAARIEATLVKQFYGETAFKSDSGNVPRHAKVRSRGTQAPSKTVRPPNISQEIRPPQP